MYAELKKIRKWFLFIGIIILLLMPWPVAYAHDNNMSAQGDIHIETATQPLTPSWNAYGKAIGGVKSGDLFYITSENTTSDLNATLLLVNIDDLVQNYRYINLNIGVYVETDGGQWEKYGQYKTSAGDTYLTMANGGVDLLLPGSARCKITIDNGCFYYYGNKDGNGTAAPSFYLSVS